MGNHNSATQDDMSEDLSRSREKSKQLGRHSFPHKRNPQRRTFPGSAILDSTVMLCGVDTTNNSVDQWCAVTPTNEDEENINPPFHFDGDRNNQNPDTKQNASALFARALVNEVTNNPNTMSPAKMTEREKRLLKAQQAAMKTSKGSSSKAVGAPGGIGKPSIFGSLAHAFGGGYATSTNLDNRNSDDYDSSVQADSATGSKSNVKSHKNSSQIPPTLAKKTVEPPNSMSENRAQAVVAHAVEPMLSKHRITVGLSLSRRHSSVGHPDTVTRQTVFDFNELQDREYKFVSSTDATGWRAGGGERGGRTSQPSPVDFDEESDYNQQQNSNKKQPQIQQTYKVAAPDTVHIPIIHIDAESPEAIDFIISALARGEVFIPHMAVLPEALSVNGVSPPDLVVRFGCERNEDSPPDEWPNWCLEFMHNQLYEYFHSMGARWMKRPFQITLAKKVRWKTVKHMNRYFAHAERVLDAWREKGPQYLDPQLSYIEGGATPEEVARPHGIYLFRNGVPTNYFAPNFDPPYTTKMTRSLLTNVLDKSWDKKRREWTSEPVPRLVTPSSLVGALCGYSDGTQGGFLATQVTQQGAVQSTMIDTAALTPEDDSRFEEDPSVISSLLSHKQRESHSPVPTPKDAPFQLHPKDSSPAQTSEYLAFVSSGDPDQNSQLNTSNNKRKTDLQIPLENSASGSSTRNLLSEMKGSSNEQQYRDTVSDVATSSVTVSRGNTTSQLIRRAGAKVSHILLSNSDKNLLFSRIESLTAAFSSCFILSSFKRLENQLNRYQLSGNKRQKQQESRKGKKALKDHHLPL
jgi:hypothetical protein